MNQKEFIKDIAVVILWAVVLVGGYFLFLRDTGDTLNETADQKTYRNEEYGFELTLTDGYGGYSTNEESQSSYYGSGKIVYFNVDATGTTWPSDRFPVFVISVYSTDWWNKNMYI